MLFRCGSYICFTILVLKQYQSQLGFTFSNIDLGFNIDTTLRPLPSNIQTGLVGNSNHTSQQSFVSYLLTLLRTLVWIDIAV